MVKIEIPSGALRILEKLNAHGYEAYVVGGCVRDSLLGRTPGDWDITTSAKPMEVKAVFKRTIDTGIQHGTVTVMENHEGYEVTTYRIDGEYEDGRHPKSVDFTSSLLEDLKRRDFTINAMACDSRGGLVDAFGGMEDLENGIIRCVGSAVSRFTEDALRILRAIRFSAQLGFTIEEETKQAISLIAPNLEKVSQERIAVEMTKLLLSDNPERMKLVYESGAGHFISAQFERAASMAEERLAAIKNLPAAKYMRWAGFLRDEPADTAVGILRDLKMDCDTMDKVRLLVSMWKNGISPEKTAIRRVMSKVGPMFDSLTAFQEAFADEICFGGTDESVVPEGKLSGEADAATVPKGKLSVETGESVVPEESLSVETGATALPKEKLSDDASQDAIPYREILPTVKTLAEEIRAAGDPLTLKDLAVTGRDLMAYGIKPGPEFGRTLNRMLDMVLEHPAYNRKDFLLAQCFGPETK